MKKLLLTIVFILLSSNTYASRFATQMPDLHPEKKNRMGIKAKHTFNLEQTERDRRNAVTEERRRILRRARLKKARGQRDTTMEGESPSMHLQTPTNSPAPNLEGAFPYDDLFKASMQALVFLGGANPNQAQQPDEGTTGKKHVRSRSDLFSPPLVGSCDRSNGKKPESAAPSAAAAMLVAAEEDDLQAELNNDLLTMANRMSGLSIDPALANAEAAARTAQRETLSRSSNSIAEGMLQRHNTMESPPNPLRFASATFVPIGKAERAFVPIGDLAGSDSDE